MQNSVKEPRRIIIHAGFHKTGTTSFQHHLRKHRDKLDEYVAIYLKSDFLEVGKSARRYGFRPFFWRLWHFKKTFRGFLSTIASHNTIFISMEEFSGAMPGQSRILSGQIFDFRTASIPLAKTIISELQLRFGQDTEITFLYTLRDKDAWLKSAYGHLLRRVRMKQSFKSFKDTMGSKLNLVDDVQSIQDAISPVFVKSVWLNDLSSRKHGTASALFDLLELPQSVLDNIPKAIRKNSGNNPDIFEALLELNQTVKKNSVLQSLKDRLIRSFPNTLG